MGNCGSAPSTVEQAEGAGQATPKCKATSAGHAKDNGDAPVVSFQAVNAANGSHAAPLYSGPQQQATSAARPSATSSSSAAASAGACGAAHGSASMHPASSAQVLQQAATPHGTVGSSLKSLTANEANAVQGTLLKVRCGPGITCNVLSRCVSEPEPTVASHQQNTFALLLTVVLSPVCCTLQVSSLIQRFAEGRSERTTPVQAVRRSLNLVITDCQAKYARCARCTCMPDLPVAGHGGHDSKLCYIFNVVLFCSVAVLSENADSALLVAAVGVQDSVHENNRLQKFPGSNSAVEHIITSGGDFLSWSSTNGTAAPSDWGHLSAAAGTFDSCTPRNCKILMLDSQWPLSCLFQQQEAGHGHVGNYMLHALQPFYSHDHSQLITCTACIRAQEVSFSTKQIKT